MIDNRTIFERKILIKRCFSHPKILEIGTHFDIPFFKDNNRIQKSNIDRSIYELVTNLKDDQLKEVFKKFDPWKWTQFRGIKYTFENGRLVMSDSWKPFRLVLEVFLKKHGEPAKEIIDIISRSKSGESELSIKRQMSVRHKRTDILKLLEELAQKTLIIQTYNGDSIVEWGIPEENIPEVQSLLRGEAPLYPRDMLSETPFNEEKKGKKIDDYLISEKKKIDEMDIEFDTYLNDLLNNRLKETLDFGKIFSIQSFVDYLKNMFGELLFFDSFLSITQQYGLADISIRSETKKGTIGMKTGFNLALFGEPGTGKSYSTRDLILGTTDGSVPAHGLPGRNRYASGMTPARFIRIGQVYSSKAWNFIVPEFNDWFRSEGMVEILKLAMERAEIRYELHKEVVGPYRFSSYFSVNYNTQVFNQGYRATVKDPNFQAIEDRMMCRLHRLTKNRFGEIAQSRLRMVLGESDFGETAQKIRDHLVLTHAIETQHTLVKNQFPAKPPMITRTMLEAIRRIRECIFDNLPNEGVPFSARLEDRSIRFASALSLIEYFRAPKEFIPISKDAQKYAAQFYIEEAEARSGVDLDVEEIMNDVGF